MTLRLCSLLLFGLSLASPAIAAERPNIFFMIADDWSREHAGVYGCDWVKTPHFDRVANEGVRFEHCYTSNPKCSPCRASILTGRNTWQLEEACNHFGKFEKKWSVYTEILTEAGYHVGYTGKGWGPGKAIGFETTPAGKPYQRQKLSPPHEEMSRIDYAANFATFLEEREGGQPFCFWLGTYEPHRSYEEGAGRRSGRNPKDVVIPPYFPDSSVIRSDFLDYAIEVEWFDSVLGDALGILERSGEMENTLIVVTSDHGCPFPRVKGQIYEDGYRLPLAVMWKDKVTGGRVVEDFINVRDFMPTYLELAGVEVPETVTGRSFVDILESKKSGWIDESRDVMLVGKERHDLGRPHDWGYPTRGIRTRDYLYLRNYEPDRWPACNPETNYPNCDWSPTMQSLIRNYNKYYQLSFGKRPAEELYDINQDPRCVDNLTEKAELANTKAKLGSRMEEMLRDEGDPRMLGRGWIFDTYEYVGSHRHSYGTWLENHGASKE
ncbi:sulfatase family protein [Stratiformator vulcanicus]|uniref:Choline-sulfatase n=1 Tax=Stratiformator vulcanicus TaxID=2527980 RepID=A0A517R489_9PLAN|nr:sulfatase [Stratiformator vulcanicus]QDT38686.1 Choline-sulfatase [Stratiformator vulcanicus]